MSWTRRCMPARYFFQLAIGDCQRIHCLGGQRVRIGITHRAPRQRRRSAHLQHAPGFTRRPAMCVAIQSTFPNVAQRASGFRRRVADVVQHAFGFRRHATALVQRAPELKIHTSRFRRRVTDVIQHAKGFVRRVRFRSTCVGIQKACHYGH